jgi:tetratricopeptide (TPR) repeat protein
MKEGIYAEAQQQFEAALKLDRSNSWVYYNLGLLFLEQRNWQQALDNLEASLIGNLKPSWIEAWAHIKRGNAYDAKGERERARSEYTKALQSGNRLRQRTGRREEISRHALRSESHRKRGSGGARQLTTK